MKCLIIDRVHELIGQELSKYMTVDTKLLPSTAELAQIIPDYDVLIMRVDPKITKEVIDAAKNLKVIGVCSVGLNHIDMDAAKAAGIQVFNAPGMNANAVAELVLGMMVTMIRNRYNGTSGTELLGKTLGIHAFGAVGRNVARIAKGFGMKVSAFDPWVKDEVMQAEGVEPIHNLEDLYRNNQYVSLHIPATAETKKSVGKHLVELMPQGAVLINAARKEVIDEESLAEAFEARPDFRYIADVKPENAAELEEKYGDRVFFTPKKMGAQTAEANINAGLAAANQVVAHLKDGFNRFQVNK